MMILPSESMRMESSVVVARESGGLRKLLELPAKGMRRLGLAAQGGIIWFGVAALVLCAMVIVW